MRKISDLMQKLQNPDEEIKNRVEQVQLLERTDGIFPLS